MTPEEQAAADEAEMLAMVRGQPEAPAKPENPETAQSLGLGEVGDEIEFISEEDRVTSMKLRKAHSCKQLLAAYIMNVNGKTNVPAFEASAKLADLLAIQPILATLNGGRPADLPLDLGSKYDAQLAYRLAQTHSSGVLRLSLCDTKPKQVTAFTSTSMVPWLMSLNTVQYTPICDKDLEHVGSVVEVENYPTVTLSYPPGSIPRVESGGVEFLNRMNELHDTNYVYLDSKPDVAMLALALLSEYKFDMVEGHLVLIPFTNGVKDAMGYGVKKFVGGEEGILTTVKGNLNQFMASPAFNKPATFPISQDPRYCLEFALCHMYIARPGFLKGMEAKGGGFDVLKERRARIYAGVEEVLNGQTSLASAKLGLLELDRKTPMGSRGIATAGDVRQFRHRNHAIYRAQVDKAMFKKEDNVAGTGFAGALSSVPAKARLAINHLKDYAKVDLSNAEVDAFGVSHYCHWHKEVVNNSKKVNWYDLAHLGPLAHGGKVERMDIMGLKEGFGRGKVLFDDTLVGKVEGEKDKFDDPTRKMASILAADYDAGFIKAMYGGGDEKDCVTTEVPAYILSFAKRYPYVDFFRITPHSEEYFIVFGPNAPTSYGAAWREPIFIEPDKPPLGSDWLLLRLQAWRRARAVEIYAANISRSITGMCGVPSTPGIAQLIGFSPRLKELKSIQGGGSTIIGRVKGRGKKGLVTDNLSAQGLDALKDFF